MLTAQPTCVLLILLSPADPTPVRPDPVLPQDTQQIAERAKAPPVISESTPRFSPDGKHVAFVANFDGPPALYLQEVGASTAPKKVAQLKGRFRRPVFGADGKHVYFTSDPIGDEAYAIKRIDLATGVIEEVAAADGVAHNGPWVVRTGDRILFSAKTRAANVSSIKTQPIGGAGGATVLFESDALRLIGARADGKQVLLVRAPLEDALFALDLPDGTPRQLYPPPGRTGRLEIYGATYSPDGARIYVATDDGADATHVLVLDARTGRELGRRTEPSTVKGEVTGLAAAGASVAYIVDLGTHSEVRLCAVPLGQAGKKEPCRTPALPLGSSVSGARHPTVTHGLALSPDGERLAVVWSTPSEPPRVQIVEKKTGRITPLTNLPRPATSPIDVQMVRVRSFDGVALPTLVYGAVGDKRPVIMWIHGGFPFASTARHDPWTSAFVGDGYVVVEPNVRGSGGFGRTFEAMDDGAKKLDGVRDFRAVGEWIASQPWADSTRMAVGGPSAGGYYTLMALAHQPELWRAGLAIVPLYDLELGFKSMDSDLRRFLEQRELVPASESGILAAISPSTYVSRIRAPVFVYAGANDVRTPTVQIEALVRDLRARKQRVEYMLLPNVGHSRDPSIFAEQITRMLRFLRTALERPQES